MPRTIAPRPSTIFCHLEAFLKVRCSAARSTYEGETESDWCRLATRTDSKVSSRMNLFAALIDQDLPVRRFRA